MFCPKCATQNLDGARFCRACGSDISLLPQVLSGELASRLEGATTPTRRRRRRNPETPSIEKAIRSLFAGIAFVIIAFAVKEWAPAGHIWWFWMFIPAFTNLGIAASQYARHKSEKSSVAPSAYERGEDELVAPRRASALPPRDTDELIDAPPSVTEATTRHLGVPVERLGRK